MSTLLSIAWRNLWRHRRRSLITATAMAVGVALCMAMLALTDGLYAKLFDVMVDQQLSHVQVHQATYPQSRSMYATIPAAAATIEQIEALPATRAATGRLLGFGLVGSGDRSVGIQLVGVDPERERRASPVADRMVQGAWLGSAPDGGIALGAGVADELGVAVGGEVVVVTQAADGSLGNALYTVRGVYRSGSVALDDRGAYVHLRDLQDLLVLPDQVHEIALLARDSDALPAFQADVRALLPADRQVRTWWEVAPQVQQLFGMQAVSSAIMLGIVFSVAGFGIVNTMLMSVFERTRELGVLKAIGLRPARIVAMVVAESLMLAGVAVAIGLVLGGLLDVYLVLHGIDFSASMAEGFTFSGVTIDPVMRGRVDPWWIVATVTSVFGVAAFAALWPAIRAARLEPVAAIRSE